MLRESKSRAEAAIQGSGHSYANSRLKAAYTVGGYLDEMMGGLAYYESVKSLLDMAENDFDQLRAKLEGIRSVMLDAGKCRDGMVLNVVAEDDAMSKSDADLKAFLHSLPGDSKPETYQDFYKEDHPWSVAARSCMTGCKNEAIIVPTQVNYVGSGGRVYSEGESMPGR